MEKPNQVLTITEEQYGDDESKENYNPNANDVRKNEENLKKKEEEEITEEWNKNNGKNHINDVKKKEVFNSDEETIVPNEIQPNAKKPTKNNKFYNEIIKQKEEYIKKLKIKEEPYCHGSYCRLL